MIFADLGFESKEVRLCVEVVIESDIPVFVVDKDRGIRLIRDFRWIIFA